MQKLALVSVVLLCFCSYSNAQVSTTNPICSTDGTINPLNNTQCLDPNTNTILDILDQGDFGTGKHNQASGAVGTGGESVNQVYHMTDRRTGAILSTDYILHFSYTDDTWVTNMAINQALVGAGFDIAGYTAQWEWKNENTNTIGTNCLEPKVNGDCLDDLVITIDAYASGVSIYSEEWDYSQTKSNGYTVEEVLSFAPFALVPGVTIDEIEVSIRGKDNGYWQGMYGPKVRNLTGGLVLMPNQCSVNPLSDPTCPGYANALFNQQCTQNPLYDPTCPGYNTALLNQQCPANPLYDPACPGYASASFAQQCDYDPLSDVQCPNYQKAWLEKKCDEDPLYDIQCAGYQTAIELSKIVDDGKEDDPTVIKNEIDVTTTTEIEGVPNVVSLPEQQMIEIVEVEDGDGFQEVEDDIKIEQMAMEDDIEKEIEELENAAGGEMMDDDIEKEIAELENTTGNTEQEDDIEKELAELENTEPELEEQPVPGRAVPKKAKEKTRNEKIKLLLAMKAIELTKQLEKEVSLEQNMIIQRQLLALISYVPGFDYNEKENLDLANFYPPKPTVDHAFARWFLNDPNFGAMEDLQYQ